MSDNNRILLYKEMIRHCEKLVNQINRVVNKKIFTNDNIIEIREYKNYLESDANGLKRKIERLKELIKQEEEIDKLWLLE